MKKKVCGKFRKRSILTSLLREESGQGLIAYALILSMVALATTFGLQSVGSSTDKNLNELQGGYGNSSEVVFRDANGEQIQKARFYQYDPIVMPTAPEKENATFLGWSLDGENVATEAEIQEAIADSSGTVVLTPLYETQDGQTVTTEGEYLVVINDGNTTTYIRITEGTPTTKTVVSLDENENPVEMVVEEGKKISDVPVPTKEGFVFDSWTSDATLLNAVSRQTELSTIEAAPIRLYARWRNPNIYYVDNLTIDSVTGIPVAPTVEEGGIAGKTLFVGWYQDAEYTQPAESSENAYAKFIDKDVLKTVIQWRNGMKKPGTFDMRLITSVPDRSLYSEVGFKLEKLDENFNTVKTLINSFASSPLYDGFRITGGVVMFDEFSGEDSAQVYCANMNSMPKTYDGVLVRVTPHLKLADGTVVEGEAMIVRIHMPTVSGALPTVEPID